MKTSDIRWEERGRQMKKDPLLQRASAPCFDALSQYCPCDLADLGQCVSCSLLRGEQTCTCGWSGLCVYSHFLSNQSKPKQGRKERKAEVTRRIDLEPTNTTAFIVDLLVEPQVIRTLTFPGSFVLLRPLKSTSRFNVPLSVMSARDSTVTVAVEVQGPKTEALNRACKEGKAVTFSGPFWSGIQEVGRLRNLAGGNILSVAKGISQAAVLQAAQYVKSRGGHIKALLGPGSLGLVFVDQALEDTGAIVQKLPRQKDHNLTHIYTELATGTYDAVLSAGSDRQHRAIFDLLQSLEDPPAFAWTSNLTMVCAEGICGSCLAGGFRGCKAQLVPEDSLGY